MEAARVLDDAAHKMTAQAAGEGQGALKVDRIAGLEVAQVCPAVGLVDDVCCETVFIEVDGREVTAVDGDGIPQVGAPGHFLGVNDEATGTHAADAADLFDYAGEHKYTGQNSQLS